MNIVLLLGHRSLSGKDTVAGFLKDLDYKRFAFADKLKETVADLYDFSHEQMHGELKDVPDERYPNFFDPRTTCVPTGFTPRRILQKFGYDQRSIYPDIWATYVAKKIEWDINFSSKGMNKFCITDFRFRNEYEVMRKWAERYNQELIEEDEERGNPTEPGTNLYAMHRVFVLPVRIKRDIVAKSGANDISEHDLDEFDEWYCTIHNDSTLENLKDNVLSLDRLIEYDIKNLVI